MFVTQILTHTMFNNFKERNVVEDVWREIFVGPNSFKEGIQPVNAVWTVSFRPRPIRGLNGPFKS